MNNNTRTMKEDGIESKIEITKEGSLGLLALGDIGLRAWRKVKRNHQSSKTNDEKE